MLKDSILSDDGSKPRGLSKNKICIGVATDKKNTVIIAEGYGKPSQKISLNSFKNHIKSGSVLVHDKEKTHRKLEPVHIKLLQIDNKYDIIALGCITTNLNLTEE